MKILIICSGKAAKPLEKYYNFADFDEAIRSLSDCDIEAAAAERVSSGNAAIMLPEETFSASLP